MQIIRVPERKSRVNRAGREVSEGITPKTCPD